MRRAIVILLAILTIPIVICVTLFTLFQTRNTAALQPIAERLGTEASKPAIVLYVTKQLEERIGSSRTEIHHRLSEIDPDIQYLEPSVIGSGRTAECVYWTLAETASYKIYAVWTLYYDENDRLVEIHIGESFP